YHVLSIWNFLILTCTIYILAPPYLAYVFRWKHIRITQRPYCALRFLMLKISGKNCGRDFARELFSLFNNPPDKIKGMEMRATTHEGMLQQLKKLEKRGLIE